MPNHHPIIVHFAIALFITAVIAEIIFYFSKSDIFGKTALLNSYVATLAAIAAVISGLLAESIVPEEGAAHTVLESHETLGYFVLITVVIFTVLKYLIHQKKNGKLIVPLLTVGLIGLAVTILTAHEGGELVFEHGIGVEMETSESLEIEKLTQ